MPWHRSDQDEDVFIYSDRVLQGDDSDTGNERFNQTKSTSVNLYMPAIVSHWSATLQLIFFLSIFIVVLIATYAGQIKNATYAAALDLNDKIDPSSNEGLGTLHRRSYFYIGSEYVSAQNSMVSSGQMYVEHLVPIKVIQPFPIVFIPGNGMVTIIGLLLSCSNSLLSYRNDGHQLPQHA